MKPIRLSRHAQGYTAKRGFTREDVEILVVTVYTYYY